MSQISDVYQSAFNQMPTPAFIVRRDDAGLAGNNQAFCKFLSNYGCPPPDSWLALSYTTTGLDHWHQFQKQLPEGDIFHCQDELCVGESRIMTELGFQVLDESHCLVCVYNTERMDLSSTENTLLKFALTESSAGLWLWEVDSDRIECSQSLCGLLDCQLSEAPKTTASWHTLVHPDDLPALRNTVERHVREGLNGYESEYRIRRGDGHYLWVKERGRTYTRNTTKGITKIIGFVEDISSQKQLEEHLRNQATFDELTGLLNRGAALTHFKKQLGLARRQYTPLTMAKVNIGAENCLAGLSLSCRNQAIQLASKFVYDCIREADVLARVEPEKLLLLLPNTSIKDAKKLLSPIVEPPAPLLIDLDDGSRRSLSFCIGLATFPEDGESIEELADSANKAVEACLISTNERIVVN